jgi:hypothetical protein
MSYLDIQHVDGIATVCMSRGKVNALHGAFRSIKGLLRDRVIETIRATESASIDEFVEIWYSEPVRQALQRIQIRR